MTDIDLGAIEAERDRIRAEYLRVGQPSSARGLHHVAVLCADVERTVRFYQGVLEFPLTEIVGNRDYEGSNHFFFDIGNAICWRSSTSPGWISVRTPRCSADCITWPSRSSPTSGSG